jgi:protein AroM
MNKIGLLTIGQSPRDDLLPSLLEILGDRNMIIEAGALDNHTKEEIKKIKLIPEDYILISRMRDGTEIKVTKKYVLPLLQNRIDEIENQGVRITLIMCTGKFPQFNSKGLIVTPSEILKGVLEGCIKEGKLGVVYPTSEQMVYAQKEFGRPGIEVYADAVSPYKPNKVNDLTSRLKERDLDLIFLNCFGFPQELKRNILEETGKPVILSNTLVARVIKELISGD